MSNGSILGLLRGTRPNHPAAMSKRAAGWHIRPDVVLQIRAPLWYLLPGVLQYAYIVIPTGFTRDTWVTAAEIRPDQPSVVHHINAIVRPSGAPWMRDVKAGVPYIPEASACDG